MKNKSYIKFADEWKKQESNNRKLRAKIATWLIKLANLICPDYVW